MITVELFILLKLFTQNEVDWVWGILFFISDSIMWYGLKTTIRGKEE